MLKGQRKFLFLMLVGLGMIAVTGGCGMSQKESKKPEKVVTSSTKSKKKDDKEVIKEKQVAFLKENENTITKYIKEGYPEVDTVKYHWDTVSVGDSGAFTEQGLDIRLEVYGKNGKKLNGYSFFIVPSPNVENPVKIESISGANFPN